MAEIINIADRRMKKLRNRSAPLARTPATALEKKALILRRIQEVADVFGIDLNAPFPPAGSSGL
jgi:hypothetical protein